VHDFDRWLAAYFGGTPPTGPCLRHDHAERWLRLHSLPGSKRYPEDAGERSEVRRRAWAAATELLPRDTPIWVVTGRYGEGEDEPTRHLPEAPTLLFERAGRYGHRLFDRPFVAFAARATWPHADVDLLLDAIVRDTLRVVWFSSRTGEVFAPYDGGIDLVLETPRRVQALRRTFPSDWLSSHPDGL